ncbi:MAG: hypothetical protein K9K21_06640, partial [Desulfotignum sp.]|nr:hypothetical protein [Desulfotignum sp.]
PSEIPEIFELSMIPSTKKEWHDLTQTQDVVVENLAIFKEFRTYAGNWERFCGKDSTRSMFRKNFASPIRLACRGAEMAANRGHTISLIF